GEERFILWNEPREVDPTRVALLREEIDSWQDDLVDQSRRRVFVPAEGRCKCLRHDVIVLQPNAGFCNRFQRGAVELGSKLEIVGDLNEVAILGQPVRDLFLHDARLIALCETGEHHAKKSREPVVEAFDITEHDRWLSARQLLKKQTKLRKC